MVDVHSLILVEDMALVNLIEGTYLFYSLRSSTYYTELMNKKYQY